MNTRRAKLRKRVLLGILGLIGLWLVLGLIFPPKAVTTPVHFTRNEQGKLVPDDGRSWPPSPALSLRFTRAAENNSLNATSVLNSFQDSRFACAHLAVVVDSPHLLAQRIAERLVVELGKQPYLNDITYIPQGEITREGDRATDLVIRVSVDGVKGVNLLLWHNLSAKVQVTASSSSLPDDINSSMAMMPQPTIRLTWKGDLDYKASAFGVESPSVHYQQAAGTIAASLGKSLGELCAEQMTKYGPLPALPAAFYPAYQPPPTFQFLTTYRAKRVSATRGLLAATDAAWRLTTTQPRNTLYQAVYRELAAKGWKTNSGRPDAGWGRLPMMKGNAVLTVATPIQQRYGPEYTVHYTAWMDTATQRKAIDTLLASHPPIETVSWLLPGMTAAQRRRVMDFISTYPPSTAAGWLTAATLQHEQGQQAAARESLLRAAVLVHFVQEKTALQSRIDDLTKKIGGGPLRLTPRLLNVCGLYAVPATGKTTPITVGLNEPAEYYALDADNEYCLYSLKVVPNKDGAGYSLETIESGKSMDSSSTRQIQAGERWPTSIEYLAANRRMLQFKVQLNAATPPRLQITTDMVR